MESYMHKSAKSVVASWFREIAAVTTARDPHRDEYVNCLGISWRVNRGSPTWGVWEEYPILKDETGVCPVWDEAGYDESPPTYEHLSDLGTPPAAILDIGIQHKGMLIAGIEIVHKHPPHVAKLQFLRDVRLDYLLILPAQWVLSHIDIPMGCASPEFWAIGHPAGR